METTGGKLDRIEEILGRIRKGGSIEELAASLHWRDFEGFAARVFSENGFLVKRNFRFSSNRKKYEIDVVAVQKPRIFLVDCKHWGMRQGKPNGIQKAAVRQRLRGCEFEAKLLLLLPEETSEWDSAITIPLLVTLFQEGVSESRGAYIVPVSRLNSFIDEARCGLFDGDGASAMIRLRRYLVPGVSPGSLRF